MSDPIVETTHGRVKGSTRDGIHSFLGIPYGASTAGPNRFKAPQPPTPWRPVRDATAVGPPAPMTQLPLRGHMSLAGNAALEAPTASEDCLTINVWTTTLDRAARRAVIVSMPHYASGTGLADVHHVAAGGEAVSVSFSHRGGITGHLYLAEIGGEEYADSGNAGTLDIVLALQWIRDNIESFGGDPSRVTLWGCSGSASEISLLCGVPQAEGLFQGGVVSEGFLRGIPRFFATMAAERVLSRLEIPPNQLHKLHEVSWQQLHETVIIPCDLASSLTQPIPFQSYWQFYPVVDGAVLPEEPYAHGCPPCSAGVPLMLGMARDSLNMINSSREWAGRIDDVGLRILTANHVGEALADEVLAAERAASPGASCSQLAFAVINHRTFLGNWIRIAEQRQQGATAPTWMYRFDYETNMFGGMWGAIHGGEFNFFLNNVDAGTWGEAFSGLYGDRADRYDLQRVLHESFIAFGQNGDPNTASLPEWTGYELPARSVMLLDSNCKVVQDPDPQLREVYAKVDPVEGPGDYRRSLIREGFVS
jgi:para-nitrobenzyl esterase